MTENNHEKSRAAAESDPDGSLAQGSDFRLEFAVKVVAESMPYFLKNVSADRLDPGRFALDRALKRALESRDAKGRCDEGKDSS